MITPRTTRLVRVPDVTAFRRAIVELAIAGAPLDARDRLIIVPAHAAAAGLLRTIERRAPDHRDAVVLPDLITRDDLVPRLAERLTGAARVLSAPEREVLAGVACRRAIDEGFEPPFQLRPGLVAEIVRFYDALRHRLTDVRSFERLALGVLEPGSVTDRGAERLVRQTRFLAAAFRQLERLVASTGQPDEHALRAQLLQDASPRPWRHVVVSVGDHAFDPDGLRPADWDLLSRIPGLLALDIVATDASVAGAFHERIHQLLPGIDEVRMADVPAQSPVLLADSDRGAVRVARDREEEVAGFARWVRAEVRAAGPETLGGMALVVDRPLPYVYLARDVLGSAGIPLQMFDALPLASEPHAAALDLVAAFVTANFSRASGIEMLRSPHFRFGLPDRPVTLEDVAALDRALSGAGYLGDRAALERIIAAWQDEAAEGREPRALHAGAALLEAATHLESLQAPAPGAGHADALLSFFTRYEVLPADDDPQRSRLLRGRAAVFDVLTMVRDTCARFDTAPMAGDTLLAMVRRWIEAHTFAPRTGDCGVHLVDAASARFYDLHAVQIAGLVEGEWPARPPRNIFYPPSLLRDLGWTAEAERLDGLRAAFADLLRLPASRLVVSAFALEHDAVVTVSPFADLVEAAGLETRPVPFSSARIFEHEALALDPPVTAHLDPAAAVVAVRRLGAPPRAPAGMTSGHAAVAYSLSGLERYQDCPFTFFAADVLGLDVPPDDEPLLSPRARGRFVHEVFQRFFEAWDTRGRGTITVERLDEARALFEGVAAPLLERFPEADARLERARLFGSAVSVGVVDIVLGLEAARHTVVRDRWLEHRFEGRFTLGAAGVPPIPLSGVVDRVDLLDGRRLRVIDYKSGYPPPPKRALQVPIYALCAQEELTRRDGQPWQVDEASYVAFGGRRPLLQIVKPEAGSTAVLEQARSRVAALVAGIESGAFPARPHELRMCGNCAYPSVCRKDYVGDDD